jgi:hypothetical protein
VGGYILRIIWIRKSQKILKDDDEECNYDRKKMYPLPRFLFVQTWNYQLIEIPVG